MIVSPSNERLAILLPSRGRAEQLKRLLDSFTKTCSGKADIIVRLGETDPTLEDYCEIKHPNLRFVLETDGGFGRWPDAGYCFALNDLWKRNPGYAAYSMMEDDMSFVDVGWDKKVLDILCTFPNRIGLVKWNVIGRAAICLAVSDLWADTLGYFQKPEMQEAGYEALLQLGRDRTAKGPTLFHHQESTRWSHRAPLWTQDLQDMSAWIQNGEMLNDIKRLDAASSRS